MPTLLLLKTWILSLLVATGDPGAPWKDTYESTAAAFAESAMTAPLFCSKKNEDGSCVFSMDGARRTAALYVSTSWFESRHNPKAEGDGQCLETNADGKCVKRGPPQSFCLGQIHESNLAGFGLTKEDVLSDVKTCVRVMNAMMKKSLKLCAKEGQDYWLSQYASGGPTCVPNKESLHRMTKAKWLFSNVPFKPDATASN